MASSTGAAVLPGSPQRESSIRVLVVHPDAKTADSLVRLLDDDADLDVLEPCTDVISAAMLARSAVPDLLIIDVSMAASLNDELQRTGLERALPVIATAAAQEHLDNLPAEVVASVLLPTEQEGVQRAILLAKVEIQRQRLYELAGRLRAKEQGTARTRPRRLAIRTDDRIVLVRPEEIDWIQAAGNYVRIHVGDNSYPLRDTMSHIELMLDPAIFMRVHRNAIVNLDHVQEFEIPPTGNVSVVLRNGKRLPLSRSYRGDLRGFLRRSL